MQRSKKYLNAHTIVLGGLVTVLLTSGVAYAANEWTGNNIKDGTLTNVDLKSGTISGAKIKNGSLSSTDILDGTIGTQDLAGGSVNSAKVLDESLTGADVLNDSIGPDDVSQLNGDSDIQDNTITTFDIATNAIDSDEVLDFGLANEDIGVLFAQIDADGTVANSSGGVTTIHLGTGTTEVDFARDISNCGFIVSQGEATPGGAPGAIMAATDRSGNANAAFVTARTDANVLTDRAFQLVVVC